MPGPVRLIGVPVEAGTRQKGCLMGPDALRTAGLGEAIASLGFAVEDAGNLVPDALVERKHDNRAILNLGAVAGWIAAIGRAGDEAFTAGATPLFMGGDHVLAAGTLGAAARHAARLGRPQFVLWLDSHPDMHTLESTESGNLHGVPVAYALGLAGFGDHFPPIDTPLAGNRIAMVGLRSVDPAERQAIRMAGIEVFDMRRIDQHGISALVTRVLERVQAERGLLHVSLDVDFLDPEIAPAVGTTVPGGATFREAHLVMELVADSGLMTSLDVAELNPFLDERGKTARLMVDLVASLFGRSVLDRPTLAY